MPALVIWERSFVAGDDLRFISAIAFLFRLAQISLISYIIHKVLRFPHEPNEFVREICLSDSGQYWLWHTSLLAGTFLTLIINIIGAFIELAFFKISGRGTPTETNARRLLVPLCKFNMVPMFILRAIGYIFLVVALIMMDRFCQCTYKALHRDFSGDEGIENKTYCPTSLENKTEKVLIFFMACDVLFPFLTLIVATRHLISKLCRRVRPAKERSLEDVQRSWQTSCKRGCECCAVMTCFLFGGGKLTSGSYADVAIALTEFLEGGGALDIVTSDIAAALICLVNVQKQKQIEIKNKLLQDGGTFAKDRTLFGRIWKQFINSGSLLQNPAPNTVEDIETAGRCYDGQNNEHSCGDEVKDEIEEDDPTKLTSLKSTNVHLENLRETILARNQAMQCISLRLVKNDSHTSFEPTVNRVLSSKNPFDCLMLGEGSRYCKVALASYTWMLHLWNNPCSGCCELTADSIYQTCTCHPRCCRSNKNNIVGGDMCGWKQAAVLKSLGIDESNLLYANFSNDVGKSPYIILRDDRWKTIVVTVRGTLSIEDMITDVTVTPKSLGEVGDKFGFNGSGEYCHSGILAGACWIHDDLKRHKILDKAMEAHPDFGLRIIGHSLGAGIAAMLGRILRLEYPKLHCLCFSPPGCVFSERTAEESKDYVCSYVLHNDIVPRLSYDSLANLRNDIVELISRMKCPKHQVFDDNLMPRNESSLLSFPEQHLHCKEEIPPSLFYSKFEQFKSRQSVRQRVRMTIPGRILRMVRISAKLDNVPCWPLSTLAKCIVSCGISHKTKKYKLLWTDPKDLAEIYISPTMLVDHFPYKVEHALHVAAESFDLADQGILRKQDQLESIIQEAEKDKDN